MMQFILTLGSTLLAAHAFAGVGKVTKLELRPGKERSVFILSYEGDDPHFRMLQSERQNNVVVEAENLDLPARLTRTVDVAAKGGPVVQLTPYAAGGSGRAIAKFVLQLRGSAEVISSELPGQFLIEVSQRKDATSNAKAGGKRLIRPTWSETDALSSRDAANEKSEETARRLVETLNAAPADKNYSGSRVSFEGSKVDVHDVFRLVGDASGLNIVTDADVKGESNYSLKNVPWDQLLDIAVQQNNLKAKVSGNVVRLVTLEKFTKEQEDKLKEISIADELEPVVMAVIPLSFARADKMKATIESLLSGQGSATASQSGSTSPPGAPPIFNPTSNTASATDRVKQDFVRGRIQIDERSNSLVVTNTKDAIERIRRLVQELDVALPQVLIDTKVVIAGEDFTRKVGMKWAGVATSAGTGRAGIGAAFGGEANSGNTSTSASDSNSASPSISSGTDSQFAISASPGAFLSAFRIGAGQHGNLVANLALAEANSLSKTIASPRVIVNNNQEAVVSDGQTINVQTLAGANSAGTYTSITAKLELKVKPQVTSSGAVLLDVDIKKGKPTISPDGASVTTDDKNLKTNVLVESGSTLVLGGVYQFNSTRSESGVPVLKDLPFIGQLFRFNSDADSKSELMVFLTPQILDTNSSVLGAGAEAPAAM